MDPIKLPCYCGSIRQASRIVTQLYDQELKPAGVKITQFGILRLLSVRPGLTTGAMADALVMDSTTLTRTLKIMHDNGWLDTRPGEDRRERHWHITPAGKERLDQAVPLWKQAQKRFAALSSGLDLGGLNDTLFELARRAGELTTKEAT